jgi:hypothetical protein
MTQKRSRRSREQAQMKGSRLIRDSKSTRRQAKRDELAGCGGLGGVPSCSSTAPADRGIQSQASPVHAAEKALIAAVSAICGSDAWEDGAVYMSCRRIRGSAKMAVAGRGSSRPRDFDAAMRAFLSLRPSVWRHTLSSMAPGELLWPSQALSHAAAALLGHRRLGSPGVAVAGADVRPRRARETVGTAGLSPTRVRVRLSEA